MTIWGVGPRLFIHTAWLSAPLWFLNSKWPEKFSLDFLPSAVLYCIGGTLVLCGILAINLSSISIRKCFKAGELCESGAYRFCRNPIYAAWILLVLPGLVLFLKSALLLLVCRVSPSDKKGRGIPGKCLWGEISEVSGADRIAFPEVCQESLAFFPGFAAVRHNTAELYLNGN